MLCGIYSVDNSLYLYTSLCVYSFSVCLSCWIVSLGKAGTVSGLVATPSLCLAQCLAHCTLVLVTRSCATLCNPVRGCPMPGSSVHGILQARVLECVAIPFSAGSSQPRDQTQVSLGLQADFLLSEPPGKLSDFYTTIMPTGHGKHATCPCWMASWPA